MAKTKKTREIMIEVARKLFAKKGVQNTMMHDIADAAGKGRRTLYTYFKNKEEIFQAVIEKELQHLRKEIEIARRIVLPPQEKLINLIYVHLEAIKTIVSRNGSLRAEFFRDIWLVERARASFDKYEESVIVEILTKGVKEGVFEILNIPTAAYLLQNAIKGTEVPYISGHVRHRGDDSYQAIRESVNHLILNGIKKR